MNIIRIFTLVLTVGLLGCSENGTDPKVRAILSKADMNLIEIPVDGSIGVYFIATVDGSDRRPDGSRMVTDEPFELETDTVIGIQRMSEDQLGLFVSDGSPAGLKWILNGIGPLERSYSTGPNDLIYSGGPRILFSQLPLPVRGRPAIQVFMVSDISQIPYYHVETNSYSESASSGPQPSTTNKTEQGNPITIPENPKNQPD